jgi:tRNA U34 5-methylaminomethyl-2-thiouridine-forming methyltransferase MnmC
MKTELIVTADGSHTVFLPEMNVTYHSRFGAVQESAHVFIKAGLHEAMKAKRELSIFEMGFGTGLNALLSYADAEKFNLQITYHALEAYPLDDSIVSALNYETLPLDKPEKSILQKMHAAPFGKATRLGNHFYLTRIKGLLQDFETDSKYDVVYFDAFAPDIQPELWTEEIFIKIFSLMHNGACLVTYCSKGSARRAMKAAGLTVTKLPGPPGKWEMVRAYKLAI